MKKRYTKIKAPSKKEKWIIRCMIWIGVFSTFGFLYFYFQSQFRGYFPLYVLLTIVLLYGACRNLYLWYHYYSISIPTRPKTNRIWTVDILTTYFPGEPYDMVLNTLIAIQKIKYPHTTYLCDEGNDSFLREKCKELGVIHVTRDNRIDAKAGNINNALRQANGEICVILDPDHIPQPNFLASVLPYFEDDQIGFVQIVQGYYNKFETLVARGAAEQTFQFYGPMMMTMNSYGTVNAIGANCTFRRSALESIGGHAPGLAEDMHTAMLLHAKKWKSVYVPQFLAKGLVPADLTSYYKQQLKWSRGTFELLYTVYPKLFSTFTLRQKIHYALLPFHYFIGFIYLLAFLIPILSLCLSEMPWTGNFFYFISLSIPVFMSSFLIRTFIQKWVIEENERGFHVIGGLLQIISWWVYLLGIVYTIFRKKIPYLPTPKDEQITVNFKLLIPNFLVGIISVFSIVYGLHQNFTPFTLVMSFFAGLNATFMFFSFYLATSFTNRNRILRANLDNVTVDKLAKLKRAFRTVSHGAFNVLRPISLPVLILSIWFSISTLYTMNKNEWENITSTKAKATYFEYLGIFSPTNTSGLTNLNQVRNVENSLDTDLQIISFYLPWGDGEESKLDQEYLTNINNMGSFPMITWEPWASGFKFSDSNTDLKDEKYVLKYIHQGLMDDYITYMAKEIKRNGLPVFLRFAHEFDNSAYPWSESGLNSSSDFKKAWIHVHDIFRELEVSNVIWVWNPWHTDVAMQYYPGNQYVDWVGVTLLNYGLLNNDNKWHSFRELYQPFHDTFKNLKKPIMLTEFGTLSIGGQQQNWLSKAFNSIDNNFDEIKALVFFNSKFDKNIPPNNDWFTESYLDWSFDLSQNVLKEPYTNADLTKPNLKKLKQEDQLIANIQFKKGFKGVSYKKSDNWMNNQYISSKNVLEKDFELMNSLGINVIKVEHSKVYEHNILKYAEKYRLKVLYSLKIPNNLSSIKNVDSLNVIKEELLETVRKLNSNSAIMGWSLFNDSSTKLESLRKALYVNQYQTDYLDWVGGLVRDIKVLDSTKLVVREMDLNQSTLKQLEVLKEMEIEFDAFGISVNNLKYWKEFEKYSASLKTPFFIDEISVGNYITIKNSIANVPVILKNWQNQWETGKVTFDGLLNFDGSKKPEFQILYNEWNSEKYDYKFPNIDILRPAVPLLSGSNITYEAIINKTGDWEFFAKDDEYCFKWYLVKLGQFNDAIAIKEMGQSTIVSFKIPKEYDRYRILLIVNKNGFSTSILKTLNLPLM